VMVIPEHFMPLGMPLFTLGTDAFLAYQMTVLFLTLLGVSSFPYWRISYMTSYCTLNKFIYISFVV